MRDFIKFLLVPLVSEPEKIVISENGHLVTVEVGPEDVGRVIGKKGTVIHHLRVLIKTYCTVRKLPQVTLVMNTPPKTDL